MDDDLMDKNSRTSSMHWLNAKWWWDVIVARDFGKVIKRKVIERDIRFGH